jgi:hypothetical protein
MREAQIVAIAVAFIPQLGYPGLGDAVDAVTTTEQITMTAVFEYGYELPYADGLACFPFSMRLAGEDEAGYGYWTGISSVRLPYRRKTSIISKKAPFPQPP